MITKVSDGASLVARGRSEPASVFPEVGRLAASEEWQTREVAATILVEIAKRQPDHVLALASRWAADVNPNIRRAASEGLRGLVKQDPQRVFEVLEQLRADGDLYVKKSVANVLRNASSKHPEAVLALCRRWARSDNPDTRWIIKDGLRKITAAGHPDAEVLLGTLAGRRTGRPERVTLTKMSREN